MKGCNNNENKEINENHYIARFRLLTSVIRPSLTAFIILSLNRTNVNTFLNLLNKKNRDVSFDTPL